MTEVIQLGQTKKAVLLADPEVRRWYDNLYSSSINTAEVAIRRLSRFSELSGTSHSALVKLEQKKLEDLVQDTVRELEKEGKAPDYIHGILKAVKSWLKHNERELKSDIRIKDQGVPVTLEGEQVPEPSQLQEILAAATIRGKVSSSFMAFSGVRPEVLGNVGGTDGLVLGDLADFNIEKLKFEQVPCQVIVRREISKVRHQYFTFLNQKGCDYFLSYLKERLVQDNEDLKPDSPVIRADYRHKEKSLLNHSGDIRYFICTQNVEEEVRRAIRRAGYRWRPYILRSY